LHCRAAYKQTDKAKNPTILISTKEKSDTWARKPTSWNGVSLR